MQTSVLAGGVGSARFLAGLVRVVEPSALTVVVNTGDDERIRGLHVSPDIDTVLYHLAGVTDWERGWGLDDETFVADERYRELAQRADVDVDLHDWFALGDRDLATHLLRTRLLDEGRTLSEATDALRRAMGVGVRVLPMTDSAVRTIVDTPSGRLSFQEYFVRAGHREEITGITYADAKHAAAAPGVLEAIASAEVLLIPPSNPLLSVEPVLSVGDIRGAVRARRGRSVAVSPIVGGRALKGPADRVLASMGYDASPAGVASVYAGLIDVLVIDERDRASAGELTRSLGGVDVLVTDTIMTGPESAARLCKEILAHVD